MNKIIDLSYDITHQMKVFPGDPAVGVLRHHNYQNGYFVSQLIIGTHAGTHVDAPVHKIKGAMAIDEISIDKFFGRAYVMDLSGLKPLDEITSKHLEKHRDMIKGIRAVILKTNWGQHSGREDYYSDFPGISEEAVEWFCSQGIDLIGLETPSVHAVKHQEIHTLLLEKGIGIVENLAHVNEIKSNYVQFFAVPLKLAGLDGSPVRAFAIEE